MMALSKLQCNYAKFPVKRVMKKPGGFFFNIQIYIKFQSLCCPLTVLPGYYLQTKNQQTGHSPSYPYNE